MSKSTTKRLLEDMLHPVRMRVMMALAGSQGMTPLQIAEALHDVPQATLYRQISRLAKAGIVVVVDERPVRGTLEKVYCLNKAMSTTLGGEALKNFNKEDHLRYFTSFAVTLVDEFARYLEHASKVDMAADGVGYTRVVLFMDDSELTDFSRTLNQVLTPYLASENLADPVGMGLRKKRIFSTVFMPEVSGK